MQNQTNVPSQEPTRYQMNRLRGKIKIPQVLEKDFSQAGFRRQDFTASLPPGATPEDALRPECWSNVAKLLEQVGVGSHIHVKTEDLEWEMEVTVLKIEPFAVHVNKFYGPVYHYKKKKNEINGHMIRWNPGKKHFEVLKDGNVIHFEVKRTDAEKWAENRT